MRQLQFIEIHGNYAKSGLGPRDPEIVEIREICPKFVKFARNPTPRNPESPRCTKADLDFLACQTVDRNYSKNDPPPPTKVQTGFTKGGFGPPGGEIGQISGIRAEIG